MSLNLTRQLFRSKINTTAVLALILFISTLSLSGNNAFAQLACKIDQITDEFFDDSDQTTISGDGNLIAFRSEANLTGQNPDTNDEIFIYDVLRNAFTQATFTTNGNNSSPFLSYDGKYLVFESSGNVNGVPNNGNNQVFLHDLMTGTNTPITNATDGDSGNPIINGLNNQIALVSAANLTGDNTQNERQVFLYNIANETFQQITDADSFSGISELTNNFAGDKIAFRSEANLTGQNPNDFPQGFIYDRSSGILSQFTNVVLPNSSLQISDSAMDGSGDLIAFSASADPNGGSMNTTSGNRWLYLFDDTPPIELLTPGEPGLGSSAISGDGSCIAFTSEVDIVGENPQGGSQIYILQLETGAFTQITDFFPGDGNSPRDPRVNEDCTRISYHRQVEKDNNVGQVFVASCIDPNAARPIPTLSEWGMIAIAAFLGLAGLIAIRRKAAA